MINHHLNGKKSDLNEKSHQKKFDRYFQIDILKGAMIFLVIFDHFVAWSLKEYLFVTFWERISIPVFLVIMGFNMGKSFQRRNPRSLRELYSWNYFKGKIKRFFIPFLILYVVSTLIGLSLYGFDLVAMLNDVYFPDKGIINLFIGFLPFWGPGNWFIPLLFQFILIIPLLYKGLQKFPKLTLISTFFIEITIHILVFFIVGDITSWNEVYIYNIFATSIFFNFFAVGLGLWLSNGYKLFDKRNVSLWILFIISFSWIIIYDVFGIRILINGVWFPRGDYNFMFFPYSAFLVLLGLNFLPKNSNGKISDGMILISNSTYHIFLIQIFAFGLINSFWGTHYGIGDPFLMEDILDFIIIFMLLISFGILWYKIDLNQNLIRRIIYYINLFIIFSSILIFSFLIQVYFIPLSCLILLTYGAGALLIYLIRRKPISTKNLAVWTSFLISNFIILLIEYFFLSPSIFQLGYILIGIHFLVVVILTLTSFRKVSLFNFLSKENEID